MRDIVAVTATAFVVVGIGLGCAATDSSLTTHAVQAEAPPPANAVTFETAVKPVFVQSCGSCHIEDDKGHLSLATREDALAGGRSGAAIVPGKAQRSLLFKMISGQSGVRPMPPKGPPLTDSQVASIRAWIDGGAL